MRITDIELFNIELKDKDNELIQRLYRHIAELERTVIAVRDEQHRLMGVIADLHDEQDSESLKSLRGPGPKK